MSNNVMFVGDTHGDIDCWHTLAYIARDLDVEIIFQVGDFGFFPGKYIHKLSKILDNDLSLFFIDGNHEDHDMLDSIVTSSGTNILRQKNNVVIDVVAIKHNIIFCKRGAIVGLGGGVNVMTMGGAYSIDKDWRLRAQRSRSKKFWWAQEEITEVDLDRAINNLTLADTTTPTVLVCHDAPTGAPIDDLSSLDLPARIADEAEFNRDRLLTLVERMQPTHIFHGHYHRRLTYTLPYGGDKTAKVEALSSNPEAQSEKIKSIENMYTIYTLQELMNV